MKTNDLTWMIGGEAGFGIQSAGNFFAMAANRGGLYAFANPEYPSLIRGGHNSECVRVSEKHVGIHKERLDLLLAMNRETLELHLKEMVQGGGVVYDAENVKMEGLTVPGGVKMFDVPLRKLAMEEGKGDITRNTVGIGACLGLVDYDMEIFYSILKEAFARKGDEVVNNNIAAARAGYDYVRKKYKGGVDYALKKIEGRPRKMLLTGNDATCLGAVKAGCKFVAEYPMTPATSTLHTMAAYAKDFNIIVKHTEDELAAINMAIGAGWAGVRAMTGTSGGGYSLMVEALGMAGMAEIPVVCVEVQRPGPSTGLPTRTEQGDLQFVLHSSQGEFPRIVIAPGSISECFYHTFRAFNLSEKYQLPVIVVSDKHIAESLQTVEPFDVSGLKVERGKLLSQKELDSLLKKSREFLAADSGGTMDQKGFGARAAEENWISPDGNFLRYKVTDDGISPRTLPGMPGGIHRSATDEHDESGDLTETEENRSMMVEKRARKLEAALKELPAPQLIGAGGNPAEPGKSDITFVTWGSPKEALMEVLELLKADGVKADLLQIVYMIPFHTAQVAEILGKAKRVVGVEQNGEAQLCALIREKTGYLIKDKILKYSGRQFTAHEIYDKTKALLAGVQSVKKVRAKPVRK
jgi:2-oxoglutarate ferredoxin oxidoreductase subunit alpha